MSTTAIGLIAGLAITALAVVAHDWIAPGDWQKEKFFFSVALAGLFATSAIGRATTHFAKAVDYDLRQLLYDPPIVVSGVALVGLLSREQYLPDLSTWVWLGVLLLFLNARNWHLSNRHKVRGLMVGIGLGFLALLIDIEIALLYPENLWVMGAVGIVGCVFVLVQFCVEPVRLFRTARKSPRPTAAELMDAVIKQVEAFIEAGVLSKEQGHPVIDAARRAIEIKNQ